MENIKTMAWRELGAYFLSPIAYAINAIFLFLTGLVFGLNTFHVGAEASLREFLSPWMMVILVLILPVLTMRLMSEELRSGTIETLMTVPITEIEVILGKFLGAFTFYVVLLLTLAVYPILLAYYGPGNFDLKLLSCHALGLLMLGGLYLSVGLFFSTCTRHQVVAVLLGLAMLALMTFAAAGFAQLVEGWPRAVLQQLAVRTHFTEIVRGRLSLNVAVFFLSSTGLFLFLSVKRLEMRRWQ